MATSARVEELKEKFDENPRRYFAPLANELRKQGDLSQAISICRAHLPNQPGHLSGHIVLAQALYEATDFEESRAEFQAALALDPENLIALRFMGDLSSASGDVEGARSWYQRVLDAEPRNYEIARIMRELNAPRTENATMPDIHATPAAHTTPVVSRAVAPERDTSSFAPAAPEQREWILPPELPSEPLRETSPVSEVASTAPTVDVTVDPADVTIDQTVDTADDQGDGGLRDTPLVIDLPTVANAPPVAEDARPPSGSLDTRWDAEAVSASELSDFEAAPEDWFTDPVDPADVLTDSHDEDDEYSEADPAVAMAGADHDIESLFASHGAPYPGTHPAAELDTPTEPATAEAHSDIPEIDFDEVEEAFGFQAPVAAGSASTSYDTAVPSDDSGTLATDPAMQPGDPASHPNDIAASEDDPAAEQAERAAHASAYSQDLDVARHDDTSTRAEITPELFADAPATNPHSPATASQWWEPFVPLPVESPADRRTAPNESQATEPTYEAFVQQPDSQAPDHIEPPIAPAADPRIARTPENVDRVPEASAAPFVTETLAELYLQQGFHEEALSIYRQLLQRNPSDDTLRDRIAAIESGSSSYALDAAAHSHGQHQQVSSAQSVRSFFGRLAKRPPRRRASVSGSGPLRRTGEFPAQSGPRDVERGRAMHSVLPNASLEPQSPVDGSERTESESLTRLFNAPALSREDNQAAAALATAFNGPSANAGRPSHVADQELSLDHLFRNPASSHVAPVSLDDFYAAPAGGTSSPTEAEPPDERAADIRQFTSWLEGLKKK